MPHISSPSPSTTPTNEHQPNAWTKAPVPQLPTTEDDTPRSRPQSPNVEQIAERNQHSSGSKKRPSSTYELYYLPLSFICFSSI